MADRSAPPPPPMPHWLLIAVLTSNLPLRPEVSLRLYHAALRLHHKQDNVERIVGDLLNGKVTRLAKDLALGTVTGPAFEADISTVAGEGRVTFILTRQGLALFEDALENGTASLDKPESLPGTVPGLNGGGYLN